MSHRVRSENIVCKGVRTHNLKGLDLEIPLGRWTAVTGVSGSGKSSLVFDTLYAEAQRRFLETLGTYERQFMQGLPQGDFESIDNVPAAVALKQTNRTGDPRSLIGTTSDVLEPLRTLFVSLMEPSCARCGHPVEVHTVGDLFAYVKAHTAKHAENDDASLVLSVPFPFPEDGKKRIEVAKTLVLEGYFRLLAEGRIFDIEELLANKKLGEVPHAGVEIVLDRLSGGADDDELRNRAETLWSQVRFSPRFTKLHAHPMGVREPSADSARGLPHTFNVQPHCTVCNGPTNIIQPGDLDWQSALGACAHCKGLGNIPLVDPGRVVPNPSLSLEDGAIKPWQSETFSWMRDELLKVAKASGISLSTPYERLPDDVRHWIWTGEDTQGRIKKVKGGCTSLNEWFTVLEAERYKKNSRILLAKYRKYVTCEACKGTRLGEAGRNARSEGLHYHSLLNQEARLSEEWVRSLAGAKKHAKRLDALREVYEEVTKKLALLVRLGLGSSSLSRRCRTLSGGEYQRVLLTRVIGNGLTDALYVLDEPSVGLGAAEIPFLIDCIRELRELGNTVVMVEHEPTLIRSADMVIELGPGGGTQGGELQKIKAGGEPASLRMDEGVRARFPKRVKIDGSKKHFSAETCVALEGFTFLHCHDLRVEFPLSQLTVVTGPSGAGKTTLVQGGLEAALEQASSNSQFSNESEDLDDKIGTWRKLSVPRDFLTAHQVISVEQRAMHRTITSVPATVLGLMDALRKHFSQCELAKAARFGPPDFSFNGAGGCVTCSGKGVVKDDLFFLGEVDKECPDCLGERYRKDVTEVLWKGRNIAQWLRTSMAQCYEELKSVPGFAKALHLALRLGLGHLPLGVATSSISGGEAQRLRICAALSKSNQPMFCILDEPTRGLSEKDIGELLEALLGLTDDGHTFVVVEHHEEFQRAAHQLVVLGPGGGVEGGRIVNREVIAKNV